MIIEQLDYSVTVEQFGTETANFFAEHPVYGTVGYPTYEDACKDMHGILGIGQYLDSVNSLIEMGLVGDHYVFNAENMITEIVNEYEGWDWTPETGIVPWESSEPELDHSIRPNRKQRRAARRIQNKRHKQSDRQHGKRRADSAKDLRRWEDDRAQMERPQVMWHLNNKGDYVPRPFQRSNRHNTHMSFEQEHLNMLKVASKRVTAEDVNWAKAITQNAAEEGQEWAIYDALAEQLDYCLTPEKEVALLTVILLSGWTEQFDGEVTCGLPATADCLNSISHCDWYKWEVKQEVPLMVEAWNA